MSWAELRRILSGLQARPSLAAICGEGFLARLGFGVITFALPFYALSLGMSIAEIGVLAAVRLVAAVLVKPLMGWAADRYGKARIYAWSIAGRCLVGALFIVATTPWALFLVRALHGVATAARDPASAVLLAEQADDERVASAFAWYHTAKEAGASLGYLIAGILLTFTHDNYRAVFSFAVLTSAVALVLVLRFVVPAKVECREAKAAEANGEAGAAHDWFDYAVLALLVATTGSMVNNLFPIIAQVHGGLSKAEIGLVLTLSTVTVIFAGPVLGWFSDHVSRKAVLALRSLSNSLSSVLYVFWPGFLGLGAARLADDVGKAAFRPAWGALMAEVSLGSGRERRGRVISYMDTAQSMGDALGPVLGGLLWDGYGIFWMFALRFVLGIAAEAYALWVLPSRPAAAPLAGEAT